jgi:phage-related tail protein
MSRLFLKKYVKLSQKIHQIKDVKEKQFEIRNFGEFNKKLAILLKTLNKEIENLTANFGKLNKNKLAKLHKTLVIDHGTDVLG